MPKKATGKQKTDTPSRSGQKPVTKKTPTGKANPAPAATGRSTADVAKEHRDKMARRSRATFGAVADIGEIPPPVDKTRKQRCRNDLLAFLVEYFPNTTGKSEFSDDHLRVIARLKKAATKGGRSFNLVYRGFAKTTISVNTAIWAILYGHRRFVVLIGASRDAASSMLDAIKAELETNDLLAEDFAEVCQAVAALEGKTQRCQSQTCCGERTHIEWKKDRIVLPSIGKYPSSGATICTRGITGSIRGLGQRRVDGTQQRPDLVIGDDLQTDKSALSTAQVDKRLKILVKTVLKLAGHNNTIACIVNGTIIEPNDLMDRLRDPNQFPGWEGETFKMVVSWSDAHETLWMSDYARLRKSFDPTMPGDQERAHREANECYRLHQDEMDAGCVVSWKSCFDPETELSAIQHAYNFLIDDGEDVFAAECQSEPVTVDADEHQLTLAEVVTKLSGLDRLECPAATHKLTAFVDIQDESLWYVVMAWTDAFTGYVIDCGIWPDQRTLDVSKTRLRRKLSAHYPDLKNKEALIRQSLYDLCERILDRPYADSEGREHTIATCLVDAADGDVSLIVRSFAKHSQWSQILRPSMGLGLKPSDTPLSERKKTDDELRRGLNWVEKRDKRVRGGSITWIDTNYWKSFVANRWRAASHRPPGDASYRPCEPGALYLWGTDSHSHSRIGAHQISESVTRLAHPASGRIIDFWSLKPGNPDNEWWDGIVGCAAAAEQCGGISLKNTGLTSAPSRRRKRYSSEELRQLKAMKNGG